MDVKKTYIKIGVGLILFIGFIYLLGSFIDPNKKPLKNTSSEYYNYSKEPMIEQETSKLTEEEKLKINVNTSAIYDAINITKCLGLAKAGWHTEDIIFIDNNIPEYLVFFPKNQNENHWEEAFSLQTFSGIEDEKPVEAIYNRYLLATKSKFPDLIIKQEDVKKDKYGNDSIIFKSYDKTNKNYTIGKVIRGTEKDNVFILKYIIREETDNKATLKVDLWDGLLQSV